MVMYARNVRVVGGAWGKAKQTGQALADNKSCHQSTCTPLTITIQAVNNTEVKRCLVALLKDFMASLGAFNNVSTFFV